MRRQSAVCATQQRGKSALIRLSWADYRAPRRRICVGEENRNRDFQDRGDPLQPPRADPVGALLVFLNLLEGESKRITELLLRHLPLEPERANLAADLDVQGVRLLLSHGTTSYFD